MTEIILFNKPCGVLSQFSSSDGHTGLSAYIHKKGFYPAGRLDRDSEGLLLLTDNGKLQARISDPRFKLPKTYLVQVEGLITADALRQLSNGVLLNDGPTLPAKAEAIDAPQIWPRTPAVRIRQNLPTSWLRLTISEGRNRQVRRMTAAEGFPTLRLIREQIGEWRLNDLQPGEHNVLTVHLPVDKKHPKGKHTRAR